ncbi:MAG: methyltransferase domain-containing protein [Candidatus Competibacter sp.]
MASDRSIEISKFIGGLKLDDLRPLDVVKLAYLLLLRRSIDPIGEASWAKQIETDNFSIPCLIDTLQGSPEYKMVNAIPFSQMVHKARQAWIKSLPVFEKILDIGGSSPNIAEGALIELGYAHRPKELVIFDLPPSEQYWGKPKFPQDRDYSFSWGALHYFHGKAEEIDQCQQLATKTFDLVFMGQVIEHIMPNFLNRVLRWIYSHLTPNGSFIFDTPNRLITSIQSPDSFIDQDHKLEYTPQQMEHILLEAGFSINNRRGLIPMPNTYFTKSFNPLESYEQPLLSDDLDQCYIFSFSCGQQ